MPETDITKMKVADLKRELKMRGLATTGNKTELQDRLQTAMLDGDISLEDASIVNDELLDEDGILTDEEESKILDGDEHELLSSPTVTPTGADLLKPLHVAAASTTSSAIVTEDDILASPTPDTNSVTGKKIVLKRKSISAPESTTDSVKNPTDALSPAGKEPASDAATAPKTVKMSQRNPITVETTGTSSNASKDTTSKSQLTMQERLELRAKKFGITPAAKPTAAAAATTATTTPTSPTPSKAASLEIIKSAPPMSDEKQVELLKKRAERFGCTVSSKIAKIDAEEKLKKRQERFGISAASGGAASESGNSVPADEKLLKRQQRFGLSGNGTVSAEASEKARARLERFKVTAPGTASAATAVATPPETVTPVATAVTATDGN